ncbi:hypothetical protein [Sphingomonas ursincola]|mgnify:CR=1 FL=1|uniref:hypothetical protein n=1 Tax=Sphingomonas ursincola TaxID=56361 RepID=UPI002355262F|nr:hypothetical protein [Sphingomonas ursincola]MBY0621687.1 hypothetical protein [Sphingomonas ursincola]
MKLLPCLALAAIALTAPIPAFADGPISKWDDRLPDFDYVSRVSLYDFERCIVDSEGWRIPHILRQPDRPDQAMLLYMDDSGVAGRIDLVVKDGLLHIKGWKAPKRVTTCAPPAS